MSVFQHISILFVLILINFISASTSSIQSTTIVPLHEQIAAEVLKIQNDLKRDEEQLTIDKENLGEEKQIQAKIDALDVIRLNVGGELIMTTRETLTRIPESIFSVLFNGRWEHKLQTDQNGNIFFDFNPIIFRHLLDQLQSFDTNNLNNISPPSDPSLITPFKKMLRKLHLHHLLSSEKNIITFNVDGLLIINRRTTFTQISNSTSDTIVSPSKTKNLYDKSDVFVDHNPKLFRHLINQLREESLKSKSYFEAPSEREKITFQKMLKDLRKVIYYPTINNKTKWKQNGITIAGGNGYGHESNQLAYPRGIYVDDNDQSIYIADHNNNRIVKWNYDAKTSQVVAGGNGGGNRVDQLNDPTDVTIDKKNDSLIICDKENRRVVRWPRRNGTNGQTIISDISCQGLTMDSNGDLYVSDLEKSEVRRWKIGETSGKIVAGGNGRGNFLNQLDCPHYIFVDEDHSVYVSDLLNHRVMKWVKGAKEGIVVAGGQGAGNALTQLNGPNGVIVDQMGNVYASDLGNNRIMRWSAGSKEGSIVVGGNGLGQRSDQFRYVRGLSFDPEGSLYVVDSVNWRVQKFDIDLN